MIFWPTRFAINANSFESFPSSRRNETGCKESLKYCKIDIKFWFVEVLACSPLRFAQCARSSLKYFKQIVHPITLRQGVRKQLVLLLSFPLGRRDHFFLNLGFAWFILFAVPSQEWFTNITIQRWLRKAFVLGYPENDKIKPGYKVCHKMKSPTGSTTNPASDW